MTAFCKSLVRCSIPSVFNCCIRVYGTNSVADRITSHICIFFTFRIFLISCANSLYLLILVYYYYYYYGRTCELNVDSIYDVFVRQLQDLHRSHVYNC
jgi:hypothetical protein